LQSKLVGSWLCSALRPHQHKSIGNKGDSFYGSKDPTNSIKVLQEKSKKSQKYHNLKITTQIEIIGYNNGFVSLS